LGITIHEVAQRAGVPSKTVSRLMNGEPNVREIVRERVREAMAALDYNPDVGARRMASDRSLLIGLFFHPELARESTAPPPGC